jgi:hypothetical protein
MRPARPILTALALISTGAALHAQTGARTHAGTIVDGLSNKPIQAEAIAYRTRNLGATGECPQHDGPLDRRTADASGSFELHVDASAAQYVVVYCASGYVSREQLENDNTDDGERVVPDPLRLFPKAERLQSVAVPLSDALQQAIAHVLEEVSDRLRQLFAADLQGFAAAFRQLLPPDQRLVAVVIDRSPRPGRREAPGTKSTDTPPVAPIAQALNAATMHLRYFAAASGAGFFPALKRFRSDNQELIEILRNRAITRTTPGR